MRRWAQPRKGLTFPAPNSEHALHQLLQGPLQGRFRSNLRGTLGGRAIAHHLASRRVLGRATSTDTSLHHNEEKPNFRFTPGRTVFPLFRLIFDFTLLLPSRSTAPSPLVSSRGYATRKKRRSKKKNRNFRWTPGRPRKNRRLPSVSRSFVGTVEDFQRISSGMQHASRNARTKRGKLDLARRMPSAGSWNATRRPDPLTASQKLLLPLAVPTIPHFSPSQRERTPLRLNFSRDIRTAANRDSRYRINLSPRARNCTPMMLDRCFRCNGGERWKVLGWGMCVYLCTPQLHIFCHIVGYSNFPFSSVFLRHWENVCFPLFRIHLCVEFYSRISMEGCIFYLGHAEYVWMNLCYMLLAWLILWGFAILSWETRYYIRERISFSSLSRGVLFTLVVYRI